MQNRKWEKGKFHLINRIYWDENEVKQVMDVFQEDWFGDGKFTRELERKLIEFSGHKHAQVTNSGSSALNLAIQTLIQKKIWQAGDYILHPINTFATSISSAIMAGLIPVYVDTDPGTYVISTVGIRNALKEYPQIKGAIIPALLGNIPDMDVLKDELQDRILILDSCDVMGSKWDSREVASYGDFAAFSFYGSHHISSFGVGGALTTSNPEWAEYVNSLTFWGRNVQNQKTAGYENFLKRYTYQSLGTDSQMTAVQAAFALAQFEKLPQYIERRKHVHLEIYKLLEPYEHWFEMPKEHWPKADVSWFSYPLVVKENAPFTRNEFVSYLTDSLVETRPVMCGDITKQTPFRYAKHKVVRPIINAERTERNGLFIPACPMDDEELQHYLMIFENYLMPKLKSEIY